MKVNMEKIEKNKVALEITIEAAKFEEGISRAYKKLAPKVNIPGFRKGKAPKAMVINQIGKEYLHEEALETILPEIYYEAIKEVNVEPIDRPQIDVKTMEEGQDVVLTAQVEVKPEVKLGQYKELEIAKPDEEVKAEDVAKELENQRLRNAQLVPIEEGNEISKGDIAQINFEGFIDEVAFPGGSGTDYPLEIGSGSFIPGFEEQLIGVKVGAEVDVNVSFPEDYQSSELAGKPALFKVKINSAKHKEIAALDDEFAKDVSEFETLEELKNDISNKLKQAAEKKAQQQIRQGVIDKVIENAEVEIPAVMIEKRIDAMIDNMAQRLQMQGLKMEDYMKYTNISLEQMREQNRVEAEKSVKVDLVLETIAKAEDIKVSDEDMEKQIEEMAEQYHQDKESIRNILASQGGIEMIQENMITEKAVDYLVEQAKIA